MKEKKKYFLGDIFFLALSLALVNRTYAQTQKAPSTPPPSPAPVVEMKLKVFEGLREGKVELIKTVTASFWRYTLSANIKAEETSDKEENQIRRVFNLKGVQLLTETNLSWVKTGTKDFHIFRLDSKEYAIMVTLLKALSAERVTCRVEVMEQDKEKKTSLLDSELTLEKNSITAFGFEDSSGKPYFLSLKITAVRLSAGRAINPSEEALAEKAREVKNKLGEVTGEVSGAGAGGVSGGVSGGVEGGVEPLTAGQLSAKDVVRAEGDIKPPELIKKVEPVYPEAARQARVEGLAILEVQTDKTGRVASVRVLKSVPMLDQAAIEAVKQWVYKPLIIDGQPKGVIFTVTVSFRLKNEEGPIKDRNE